MNQKNIGNNESETIDIRNLAQEHFDPYYNRFHIANNKFIGQDSIVTTYHLTGKILSTGKYARNRSGVVTLFKIGEFENYYPNGRLKEKGKYDIGRYTQCCAGGLCSQFYNYKLGEWKYYYPNGNKKANVIYQVKEFQIETSCEGGDKISFGKINLQESEFWNEAGKSITPSTELINEMQTVVFNQGDYHSEVLSIIDEKVKLDIIANE